MLPSTAVEGNRNSLSFKSTKMISATLFQQPVTIVSSFSASISNQQVEDGYGFSYVSITSSLVGRGLRVEGNSEQVLLRVGWRSCVASSGMVPRITMQSARLVSHVFL